MPRSRKSIREDTITPIVNDLVIGLLEQWGLIMYDEDGVPPDTREPGERLAMQIGEDESVEHEEVYEMIRWIAQRAYAEGRRTDLPITAVYPPLTNQDALPEGRIFPTTQEDWKREHRDYEGGEEYSPRRPVVVDWFDPTETPTEAIIRLNTEAVENAKEAQRLADIIKRAYGTEGWDIGSMKNVLLPGLKSQFGASPTPARAVPPVLEFTDEALRLEFGEGSSEHSWWIELVLADENNEDRVRLPLSDVEAAKLSDRLAEKIREGRKDWS